MPVTASLSGFVVLARLAEVLCLLEQEKDKGPFTGAVHARSGQQGGHMDSRPPGDGMGICSGDC